MPLNSSARRMIDVRDAWTSSLRLRSRSNACADAPGTRSSLSRGSTTPLRACATSSSFGGDEILRKCMHEREHECMRVNESVEARTQAHAQPCIIGTRATS
eukprot:6186304-Pleurochrysis_carterae.AAC.2